MWSQTGDKENSELAILSESFSNKESECHQSEKSECSLQREGQTKDSEMNCESEIEEILGLNSKNESKISSNVEIPNLLAITPSIGSVLSFGNMTKSYERFELLILSCF